jgi:hypothetical protein
MWFVLIAFLIIGLIDLPRLIRQKRRWELAAYIVLFAAAFTTAALQSSGVKLPSPMLAIQEFMKYSLHIYYQP